MGARGQGTLSPGNPLPLCKAKRSIKAVGLRSDSALAASRLHRHSVPIRFEVLCLVTMGDPDGQGLCTLGGGGGDYNWS